ncbi:hypothetical protein G4B88_028533 [Cannabis sativa]|uniref:Uncharacterized protein n=1 Tax=Cannabis sativa TaxID=3483 RepID=A0A7J6GQT8_CANSA|nr:hypothetical protein G4B88_028533 [Cannabis sativa]
MGKQEENMMGYEFVLQYNTGTYATISLGQPSHTRAYTHCSEIEQATPRLELGDGNNSSGIGSGDARVGKGVAGGDGAMAQPENVFDAKKGGGGRFKVKYFYNTLLTGNKIDYDTNVWNKLITTKHISVKAICNTEIIYLVKWCILGVFNSNVKNGDKLPFLSFTIPNHQLITRPELFLKVKNNILVQTESPSKKISINRRSGSKHSISNGNNSRILATKTGESHRGSLSDVELEVNQSNREDEHVTLVQDLCEEQVLAVGLVRGHESHVQCSFHHHQYLASSWVSVGRVLAVGRVVYTHQ